MREVFTWSPVTMHPKIPHRFYKRTILRPLNLAKVFTVYFTQIYLTIPFLSITTSSKLSPLMLLFHTYSSTYFLVFRSFCLSCPFHTSHFIHLKYMTLKAIELDYVAPPHPNTNVRNLSWNRRGISCGLLWLRLWKLRLPSTRGNTANNWSKTGLDHQFQDSIEFRTLKSHFNVTFNNIDIAINKRNRSLLCVPIFNALFWCLQSGIYALHIVVTSRTDFNMELEIWDWKNSARNER